MYFSRDLIAATSLPSSLCGNHLSRAQRWRGPCCSRGCSGHGHTVSSVEWQVKKNESSVGLSQTCRPTIKLGGFVQLRSYVVHQVPPSALAMVETPKKSYRASKFCAVNAYMSLPLTSHKSLVYMTKASLSGSVSWISGSLVAGGMRQEMRMA